MIAKLNHLSENELKDFYRHLTSRMLEVFSQDYYETTEDLQADFHEWKTGDIADYHTTVDGILAEIAPNGIVLTWRDLGKLNYKRWHLCLVCKKPFLSYSSMNKARICYGQDYVRYKIGTEESAGEFYKSSLDGKTMCFMTYHATKRRKVNNDQFRYVRPH